MIFQPTNFCFIVTLATVVYLLIAMKLYSALAAFVAFIPFISSQTIVDVAVADPGTFSTLVSLVEAAGLVETLNGEGPFTVSFDC